MNPPLLVFDLDGTLIDSLGGITNSVNCARRHLGAAPLTTATVREYIGDGSRKLAERAFADLSLGDGFEAVLDDMVSSYAAEPVKDSRPYPGVMETLQTLKQAGCRLTVFSNKPERVGSLILGHFHLSEILDAEIGGGSRFPLKPAPDAILYLMKQFDATQERTFVVGDNHTDLRAAAAAHAKAVFATYGFGHADDAKADYVINSFSDLLQIIPTR